jgi:hypothetical protein
VPFARPAIAFQPDRNGGMVELTGKDYRVAIKSAKGDTLRILQHDVAPVSIGNREWDSLTAEFREFKSKNPLARCTGSMTRPDRKPAATNVVVDDRGRIWVERAIASGSMWEIWEGDRIVGSVRVFPPRPSGVWDIRGDRIAMTRTDADGGIVVVFYRFTPVAVTVRQTQRVMR